jgi:hypothetical protein
VVTDYAWSYNIYIYIFSGEEVGPAWKEDNKRISGNRHLYASRRIDRTASILS